MALNLDPYRGVIKMVFAANAAKSPEVFYEELDRSIQVADALLGDMGRTTASSRTSTVVKALGKPARLDSAIAKIQKKAVLLSATPPPVAGVEDTDEETEDDRDYWETKPGKQDGCNRLETKLKNILPASIQIEVPGVDKPIELVRGVGGPGLKFVYVTYAISGDSLGTRYTLTTSIKPEALDPDAIIADIIDQAAAIYSGEQRVIVPHVTEKPFIPNDQHLAQMLARDRQNQKPNDGLSQDELKQAGEDARSFQNARENSSRWQ